MVNIVNGTDDPDLQKEPVGSNWQAGTPQMPMYSRHKKRKASPHKDPNESHLSDVHARELSPCPDDFNNR